MTSTYNDIRAAIEGHIATEMALAPSYPVAYENVPFTPPNNLPWIQVKLTFGDNNYSTLQAPSIGFNRQNGLITIDIFTPVGVGAAANYTIAERIKDLFDRQTVSSIIFDAASGPAQVAANVIETGVGAASGLAASYFQTELIITFTGYVD